MGSVPNSQRFMNLEEKGKMRSCPERAERFLAKVICSWRVVPAGY